MPHRTIWEKEGVIWEFYGHVTAREIADANEEFIGDPRSKNAKYQIVDAINTIELEWNPLDIVEMSVNDVAASRSLNNLKLAFLTNSDKIREKVEKYVNISRNLNSDWKFRGFNSLDEAREWIGL
jgi:hypothetical protein